MEHHVPQHVLEGSAHLQDSLPGGGLAHTKEVADMQVDMVSVSKTIASRVSAGKSCHMVSVLPLQVQVELIQEVLEGGLGHPEHLQPLLIIPGGLDDVQPPVLAGQVGPEAMGLEAQEGMDGPSSGMQDHVISVPARDTDEQ
ncbi:hypothetical protein Y1Q_0022017 [Alligator mississippiensis]|uniref:Uncharacterized protein n=1 Tax=Alligator mississippiensis TaxID=8496 RepID=A0A151NLQ6_ALLMI|nr:hypothetical protein Y1Q_0022017 [Alligator mississippiensis]